MSDERPAEVFHPGEYILDELEERGWSQVELADILGRPAKFVSELVTGLTSITPETALGLAEAFGTSPDIWIRMQATYDLGSVRATGAVARKARLYEYGPIMDMVRRGWIEASSNIEVLEQRVAKFYGISQIGDPIPPIEAYARKTTSLADYKAMVPAEKAWLWRARQLAIPLHVTPFKGKPSVDTALTRLRALMASPEAVRQVPKVLAECGIRFVVVKHLPGTRIDGLCFWLNESSPVIALSMRYGRIDWFWFTLLHELGHVAKREHSIDSRLVGEDAVSTEEKPQSEQEADRFAVESAINQSELETFIKSNAPLYSHQIITGFALINHVHPGIVIGQLQYRKEIGYRHSRQMLVPVREIITTLALTDGWGTQAPPLAEER